MRSKKTVYEEQERLERDWILFNKRRAVLEHRKMWKWIAHAIAVDKENMHEEMYRYKQEYLVTMILLNEDLKKKAETKSEKEFYDKNILYYRQTMVDMNCFCCMFRCKYENHAPQFEIVQNKSCRDCQYICPIVWEYTTLSGTKKQMYFVLHHIMVL